MRFPGLAKDWQLLPKIEAIEESFQGKNDIVISDIWMLIFKTEKINKGRVQAPSQTRQQKPDRRVEARGCPYPVWNCRKNGSIGSKNSLGVSWRKSTSFQLGVGRDHSAGFAETSCLLEKSNKAKNQATSLVLTRDFPGQRSISEET